MELTHKPEVLTSSAKFASFLIEGLAYINYSTPTMINSGGCGQFAHMLAEELERCGIPYKLIAIYNKSSLMHNAHLKTNTVDFLRNDKKNIPGREVGVSHVMTLINDCVYIDSEGIENAEFYMHHDDSIEITKEELAILNQTDCWNPMFDKGCIPKMKICLKKMFDNIETFETGMFHLEKLTKVKLTAHTIKERQKQQEMSGFNHLFQMIGQ